MLTLADVIDNCELAYQLHDRTPVSIKEAARGMLADYNPPDKSPVKELLCSLAESPSPRVHLSAAKLKLQFIEDETVYVEECNA